MFLKVRWIKVLREMWDNKARTLLVVLSIAVGVFSIGTITTSWIVLLNDLITAYQATNPASATLTVSPFDDALIQAVRGNREIAQAEGRRIVAAKGQLPDGTAVNLNLTAVDDFAAIEVSQMMPEAGVWPPRRRELLLERSYAKDLGLEPGDTLTVEMPSGSEYELVVAGTVHDLHVVAAGNSEIVPAYITMDTLQWLGETRQFNALYITVAQDVTDKAHIQNVVTAIREQIIEKSGFTVLNAVVPTPGEPFITIIIRALLLVLGIVGVFSLVLSAALVINTVSAVITRQVRQIGVMKAIGGAQANIAEIYLSAVVIYGLLSLLVAVPLAALGANAFTNFFAEFSNFDIMSRGVPWIVLLIEIIIALLVPILAATIPVNTAMRLTVREAIADSGLSASDTQSFVDKLALSLQGGPVALALALRNTFRRKSRLVLTLGTLTLAGAIFISVLSVRDALFGTFDRALAYYGYDLSIDLGGTYRIEQIQREAARESGVFATEGWFQRSGARIRPDGSESANYSVIGVPLDTQFIVPELRSGTWVNENVRNGIVVNTDFSSDEQDVQVGDILTLKIGSKETEWMVIGICTTQYSQPVLYANIDDLGRAVGQVGYANRALIKLTSTEEEFQSNVARNLEERFKRAGLLVGSTTTRSEFVETFSFRFDFLIIFLLMLAVLLAFVGGLGLAGTMGLNVLERIREIGVLRAVGAASKSVERIVLAEGLVIGGISWVVAVVLAAPLAYGMSTGVGLAFGGEPLVFTYSIAGAVIWLALVMGIATVSSYAPARRASSITVREVLAYE